jgi:small-conductance mechanosensitive channel
MIPGVKGVIGVIAKVGIVKLASATVSIVVEEVVEKTTKEVNDSEDTDVESVPEYRVDEILEEAEITSLNKDTIKILLEGKAEAEDQSEDLSETYEKIKEKFQSFSGDKVVTARKIFPNNKEDSQNKRSENPRVV